MAAKLQKMMVEEVGDGQNARVPVRVRGGRGGSGGGGACRRGRGRYQVRRRGDGAVKDKADELKEWLDVLRTSTNGLVCQLDDIVGCERSCPNSAATEFPRTNE